MSKIVAGLFISLDGVVEAPHRWQFDHFDEDVAWREWTACCRGG